MRFEKPGHGQGVGAVPGHPQVQRLQPLQEEEALKGLSTPPRSRSQCVRQVMM